MIRMIQTKPKKYITHLKFSDEQRNAKSETFATKLHQMPGKLIDVAMQGETTEQYGYWKGSYGY